MAFGLLSDGIRYVFRCRDDFFGIVLVCFQMASGMFIFQVSGSIRHGFRSRSAHFQLGIGLFVKRTERQLNHAECMPKKHTETQPKLAYRTPS